jgi:hypothetical protein
MHYFSAGGGKKARVMCRFISIKWQGIFNSQGVGQSMVPTASNLQQNNTQSTASMHQHNSYETIQMAWVEPSKRQSCGLASTGVSAFFQKNLYSQVHWRTPDEHIQVEAG